MVELRLTYYPDITQAQTPDDVRDAVSVFADALAARLASDLARHVSVRVMPVLSVPEQYESMVRGETHIGLMKPVAYVFAHQRNGSILPACVALRPIDGRVGEFYYGQVYAREASGIRSLSDLTPDRAGTLRIAYGDRFSTSNFLVPAYILKRRVGIHPFLYFKNVEFAGGHDLAAEAVYEGRADIGAGHDGSIQVISGRFPDASARLVQIGRENIHSDPVVVNASLLPDGVTVQAVSRACIAIASTSAVQSALDLFWGWVKGLAATQHANYASIENALRGLHLNESDMLT